MKSEIQLLVEGTQESMSDKGFDIMTESKEIFSNDEAFDLMLDSLSEGLDEGDVDSFRLLAKNTRDEFLIESNTSASLNAFAPMQMTLLRSIHSRLLARASITSKTMSTPAEQFGWLKSYIRDAAGNRVETVDIDGSYLQGDDLAQSIAAVPFAARDLFAGATVPVDKASKATVDRNAVITSVTVIAVDDGGINPVDIVVAVNLKPDTNGLIYGTVAAVHTGGDATDNGVTIIGKLDREAGTLDLAFTTNGAAGATVKDVVFAGRVSFESNQTLISIENEYIKDMIEASDGELVHSSLPYTYLKDTKALFNVDAMGQAVNTLGSVFSHITDIRILNDLYQAVDDNSVDHNFAWDATPVAGSISRIDHNLELVERINRAIAFSDQNTQFSGNITFTILANSVDAGIVSSTNITSGVFSGKIAQGGVIKNYTAGELNTSNGTARILSSKLVRSGEMLIVPKSDLDNEVVYGQFDYSQVMLGSAQGYTNPDQPAVTSIAMLNRDTRKSFRTNGITKITVAHNLT